MENEPKITVTKVSNKEAKSEKDNEAEDDFESRNEPKVKMRKISSKGAQPKDDEYGLQSFEYIECQQLISINQCCGILIGIFICFIVFLPIILSWGASAIFAPQQPLIWATANHNEAVAIKV